MVGPLIAPYGLSASTSHEYRAWGGLVQHTSAVGTDRGHPPAEFEAQYYQQAKVTPFNEFGLRNSRYDSNGQ